MVKSTIGAVIGGVVGAAIWAAVGLWTGYEVGWVAWGVGALVGAGAAALAGKNDSAMALGVMAGVVAAASVAGGKYAWIYLDFNRHIGDMAVTTSDDVRTMMADEVAEEFEKAGKTLAWPAGMDVDTATQEADYPPEVWKEMETRWAALGEEGQRTRVAETAESHRVMIESLRDQVVFGAFKRSFGGFDLLWFGLAVVTAFQMGAAGGNRGSSGGEAAGA